MRVTRPQLSKIWTTAKERGLSPDQVRDMTPAGSVGSLTTREASELIDALVRGRAPDYSRCRRSSPSPSASSAPLREPRRPRASAGVIRLPSPEAALLDSSNISWLAEHWRHKDGTHWTELQVLDWLGTRHFKHGGPMNVCRSARDLADRIEFTKGLIMRTKTRDGNRQARADVQDYRDRAESTTTKHTKRHEGCELLLPFAPLRVLRGEPVGAPK